MRHDRYITSESYSALIETEFALFKIAMAIRDLRKVRRAQFGLKLGEPAWDMLVELYFRENTGNSTTRALLQKAAEVPSSTAARWLKHLTDEGYIRTSRHSGDTETSFVEMTDRAREAVERYLTKVRSIVAQHAGTADFPGVAKLDD